jgi:molecular chaperone GrpE
MNKHHRDHPEVHQASDGQDKATKPEVVTLTDEMITSTGGDSQVKELEAKLAAKDKELAEFKDKYLRALADGENARKRIRQQSEDSVRLQKENLLRDLLPIVDNLERAIDAAKGKGGDGQIMQGVEMVVRSLLDFLKSQGVVPIHSTGQQFDPSRHEAVDHVATASHPANTVVDEFHRGYLIGERVLRPARVSVAKEGSGRSNGESDNSGVEND